MNGDSLQQAPGVRLFIAANVLFWSLPIQLNLPLTLLAALWVPATRTPQTRPVWIVGGGLLAYGLLTFLIGPCADGGIKVLASAIIVALLLAALLRLSAAVRYDRPLLTSADAAAMLCGLVIVAAAEYAFKAGGPSPYGMLRVGGLYLEPSHLALSATPLMFWLWMRGSLAHKAIAITCACVLMVVSYSTTLLALLVTLPLLAHLGAVFQRRINPVALVGLAVVAAAPLALPLLSGFEDTFVRLSDLTDLREDANLSSLVYANGWQLLDSYFQSTRGLGLGLNAMGCSPRAYTGITEWLELADLGDQNFNDGSFILSKLGSEFGVVGLLLFAVVAFHAVRSLWRAGRRTTSPAHVIAAAWLAIIGIGGLIRSGGGYFAGPVLLAVFAVLVMRRSAVVEAARPAAVNAGAAGAAD